MSEPIGLVVVARSGPGVLHELTGVIARHNGDIASVEIIEEQPESRIYFEIDLPEAPEVLQSDLVKLPIVRQVDVVKTLQKIYGKRIIIVGGGAQVGQVAIGAISEADRHNIRGEHISVDTIPLVGEQPLADAVRAVGTVAARPRAGAGRFADGRRDREGGAGSARAGTAGDQPEYGRQRARCRGSGGDRSGAGRRDGGDGGGGYGQVHGGEAEPEGVLGRDGGHRPFRKVPASFII